jgi:hypothetical protein
MSVEPFPNTKKAEASNADDDTDRKALTTFTGTKLDWLNCLAADQRISDNAFRVAFVIAQHLNWRTGQTMLSDETIADEASGSIRAVVRSRTLLRQLSWLIWRRTQIANVYSLDFRNMNAMRDAMLVAREARQERRKHRGPNVVRYAKNGRSGEVRYAKNGRFRYAKNGRYTP